MATTRKCFAIIALAALAISLGACSKSSHSSATSAPAAGPAADNGSVNGKDLVAPTKPEGGAATTPAPIDPASLQRSIIYDGSLAVRVDNVDTAAASAEGAVIGTGGYVGGDNRVIDAQRSSAVLVLRVPAAKFAVTMDTLSQLGRETQRQVSTQDVTAQVIDVNSRVKTQQASVDRIRALLAKASSIGEIVSLESELTRREADLESLQAQQRNLSDLTALSTITLTLLGPEATTTNSGKKDKGGFLAGLRSGWHTFVSSVSVLVTIIGALLPFLVVIGGPLMTMWWLGKRRRRQSALATTGVTTADDSASISPAKPGSSG